MKRRIRTYSGAATPEVTARETAHIAIARKAAADGIVLMKNNGILPLSENAKVFLAGSGAVHAVKGGTGSGDVNEREVVDLFTGLEAAGVTISNREDMQLCFKIYDESVEVYRQKIIKMTEGMNAGSDMNIFGIVNQASIEGLKNPTIDPEILNDSDAALFVISRVSGEGFDRSAVKGDYYMSDEEAAELKALCEITDKVIVLLNVGGQVDLKGIYDNDRIAAVLNISQGGMTYGPACADILTGKVTPSGKLVDTWTVNYEDFPNSATYSHNNGNVEEDFYEDGIYVGYRYFDSFGVKPAYAFGFGLSYTSFEIDAVDVKAAAGALELTARVTNTGSVYTGREVVQVYAACPQTLQCKEFKRLVGFAKTKDLAPGQSESVKITIDSKMLASYCEANGSWMVEAGEYGILVGNSSDNTTIGAVVKVEETVTLEEVKHIMPLQKELHEMSADTACVQRLTESWKAEAKAKGLVPVVFTPLAKEVVREALWEEALEIASKLTDDELIAILIGEMSKGQDHVRDNTLVDTGIYVPGAAGETTCALEEKYGITGLSMADGPAGLRVLRSYDVDKETGLIYGMGLLAGLNGGMFAKTYVHENVDTYYMYATALPIGTCLAQTFDLDLMYEVGQLVGREMVEFGISWWLAPGMNIHKNPLCGRNFEYYSEDPLVAGRMAGAITRGVQSLPGVGTTIKHFACNSQEDERADCDAIIGERALREIYLRGFEIAVKEAQPRCIMTSYNLINGIHTANNYDLCTVAAREEWGFSGIFITDWVTTLVGKNPSVPHKCTLAGNDLIMPGTPMDAGELKGAIDSGELPRETARACAARLIHTILKSHV